MRNPIMCDLLALAALSTLLAAACGDDGSTGDAAADATPDTTPDGDMPDTTPPDGGGGVLPTYGFESRFNPGENSVDHTGQTTRQILLIDLVNEMKRIADGVRDGSIDPTMVDEEGEVVARLDAFYRAGSTDLSTRPIPTLVGEDDAACQATYEDLGDANLFSKTAGQDTATDYRDWSTGLVGFSAAALGGGADVGSPVGVVDAIFTLFESQVRACALDVSGCPSSPGGDPLPLYVTPDGLDLSQLLQKHLLGAIHFAQGSDDYLDSDVADKGLLSDNTMPREDGNASTTLEHAWDEAFGYFGAAHDYDQYTDDEIRGAGGRPEYAAGYHDFDGSGCVDAFSEYNFAGSVNAAKRDAGATTTLDLTDESFSAFVAGRALITNAGGALSAEQVTELEGYRDDAVSAWERAYAATAIHYINEVRADMAACGTAEYSFTDHAKHWGELKGFAMSFQYNPRSPFVETLSAELAALHADIGDAPVLCAGDTASYDTALVGARDVIRDAYGFDASDAENW